MLPSPDDPDSYAIEAQQKWLTVRGFRIDIDRSKNQPNEPVRLRNCQNVELGGKARPFGTSRERYQKNFRNPRCRIRTPACALWEVSIADSVPVLPNCLVSANSNRITRNRYALEAGMQKFTNNSLRPSACCGIVYTDW
jgi:hypothetical protein